MDYESERELRVTVQATDSGGLQLEQMFAVVVTDVNEPPEAIVLSNSTVSNSYDPVMLQTYSSLSLLQYLVIRNAAYYDTTSISQLLQSS